MVGATQIALGQERQRQPIQTRVLSTAQSAVSMCNVGMTGSAKQESQRRPHATCKRGTGGAQQANAESSVGAVVQQALHMSHQTCHKGEQT